MKIIESTQPRLDYSQAVVRVQKKKSLSASPVRYNKISVIAAMDEELEVIDSSSGGLALMAESQVDLHQYLSDDEVNQVRDFVGIIKLHNNLDDLDLIYKEAAMWGLSLIFTAKATQYIMDNELPLPNDQLYCWLTLASNEPSDAMLAYAQQSNVGLMLNSAGDERLLYTISRMMEYPARVLLSNSIANDNFSGVTYLQQADFLAQAGVSFWLKTVQKTYPFALFLGGEQAYVRYYDAIIEHEVREEVAAFIASGATMSNLDLLSNCVSMALARFAQQMQSDVTIEVPHLGSMSAGNRRAGIVDYLEIRYALFGEVRSVHISV
jgi:hypothetical protein